ncbi:MAG: flagellin [Magnetococcales bacterium]|nr:flagellin [Magnetococcales bacterium]
MAITIQNAQLMKGLIQQTGQSVNEVNDTLKRISTGLKINSSADGAALLEIANKLGTEVRGLNQAMRNTNDGISTLQVADAGLESIQSSQARLKELAVQSANGTLSDSDRQAINQEAQALQEQINSTISDTSYNGQSLLNSGDTLSFQTGSGSGDATTVTIPDLTNAYSGIDLSTQAGAEAALTSLDTDINTTSDARSTVGSALSSLESRYDTLATAVETTSAAQSRIQDTDVASDVANLVSASIRGQGATALQAQSSSYAQSVLDLL